MVVGAARIWMTFNDAFGHRLKDDEIVKSPKLQKILANFLHIKKSEVAYSAKIQIKKPITDVFEVSKPNIFKRIRSYFKKRQYKSDSAKVLKAILTHIDHEVRNKELGISNLSIIRETSQLAKKITFDLCNDKSLSKRFPVSEKKIHQIVLSALEARVAEGHLWDEFALASKIGTRDSLLLEKDLKKYAKLPEEFKKDRKTQLIEKYLEKDVTFLDFAKIKVNKGNLEIVSTLLKACQARNLRVLSMSKEQMTDGKRIHAAQSFLKAELYLKESTKQLSGEIAKEFKIIKAHYTKIPNVVKNTIQNLSPQIACGEVDNSILHDPEIRKNLMILTKVIECSNKGTKAQITSDELQGLTHFLTSVLGDKYVNKLLVKLENDKFPDGISYDAVRELKKFTFKSSHIEKIQPLAIKLEGILARIDDPSLKEEDKLSISELGTIYHFSKLSDLFEMLTELGAFAKEETYLSGVAVQVIHLKDCFDKLEKAFEKQLMKGSHYQNGDFLAGRLNDFHAFKQAKLPLEQKLMNLFVTDLWHGGYLYRSHAKKTEGKVMLTEIMIGSVQSPLALSKAAYSDIWRLNVVNLLLKKSDHFSALALIAEAQGTSVEEIIKQVYSEAVGFIQEDRGSNFVKFANEKPRRFFAGMADYGLMGGHKRLAPRKDHFFKVHQRLVEGSAKEGRVIRDEMICSEFVTKSIIAAIIETDVRLEMMIRKHQKGKVGPVDRKAILQDIRNNGTKYLHMPYSSHERLKRIHPGRMVNLLFKKGLIAKVPKPPLLAQILRSS